MALFAFGQKGDLKFEETTYDFGNVAVWANQEAEFIFTNEGDQPVVFLPTPGSSDCMIAYPPYSVMPGQSASLYITYYTNKTGGFNEKVEVYHSLSDKPVKLTVKGSIKSISPTADLSCPGFSPKDKSSLTIANWGGQVIDEYTQQPIDKAKVIISAGKKNVSKLKTKEDGFFDTELQFDLYDIEVTADGYEDLSSSLYINKMTPFVVLELTPLEVQPPVIASTDEPEVTTNDPRENITETVDTPEPEEEEIIYDPREQESTTNWPDEDEPEGWDDEIVFETFEDEDEVVINIPGNPPTPEEIEVTETPEEDEVVVVSTPPTPEPEPAPLPDDDFSIENYAANNIVFLIDVSSSMKMQNKMELLKSSMQQLVGILRDVDRVALITYAYKPSVVFTSTPGDMKDSIATSIDGLEPYGLTNGVVGITKAYEIAQSYFIPGGNNQLIMATDGKFDKKSKEGVNVYKLAKDQHEQGISLSVIGFGDDEDAIKLMQDLAESGSGSFLHITSEEVANSLLVQEIKDKSRISP